MIGFDVVTLEKDEHNANAICTTYPYNTLLPTQQTYPICLARSPSLS